MSTIKSHWDRPNKRSLRSSDGYETSCTEHGTKRLLGFEVGANRCKTEPAFPSATQLCIYKSRTHLCEPIIFTTPKPKKYGSQLNQKWCDSSLPFFLPSCWRSLHKQVPSFRVAPIVTVSNTCTLSFILGPTPTKTFAQMSGWIWKDFNKHLLSQDILS